MISYAITLQKLVTHIFNSLSKNEKKPYIFKDGVGGHLGLMSVQDFKI